MIALLRYLRSIHPLSESLRDHLEDMLKEKRLARTDYLVKPGQICGNIYYIEKGLLRTYYNKGGKEISSGFMKEGEFCMARESFFSQQYTQEGIEALEDTLVYYISYQDLQQIYQKFIEFNYIGRTLQERCHLSAIQRWQTFWMQSAENRYNWLIANFPDLVQRVPGKYLASYLGMTPQMLSIIRGRKQLAQRNQHAY